MLDRGPASEVDEGRAKLNILEVWRFGSKDEYDKVRYISWHYMFVVYVVCSTTHLGNTVCKSTYYRWQPPANSFGRFVTR
jgi:hypothetical protein